VALIPILFFVFVVIFISIPEIRRVFYRPRAMRELADKEHLLFLDGDVRQIPDDVLALISPSMQVANCVFGLRHGEKVLAFDYGRGWGRKWWRSAIAVEQTHPKDIRHTSRYQNWVIGTRGQTFSALLSPKNILRQWDLMQTATDEEKFQSITKRQPDEVVIRPRHERP